MKFNFTNLIIGKTKFVKMKYSCISRVFYKIEKNSWNSISRIFISALNFLLLLVQKHTFVLNGGDRGRLLPDSESESLKMLLWASILVSAVVSFFLDDFVSAAVSFADSEDLDSALELRVVTVFLGWGCFFWPPRPPWKKKTIRNLNFDLTRKSN